MKTEKLNGKDLINVGIFSAIYFVIMFACAMIGYIPIMMPMLTVLVPIIGGVPFMLFLTKVKKPGMIYIMGIIMGIMMILTGMGWYALAVTIVSGLVAELIYRGGRYASAKAGILTSGVFSLWVWGNFLPIFFNPNSYWVGQDFTQEYAGTVNGLMPAWSAPIYFIVTVACGIIGGLLGKALLKKHFKKAGIA